MNILKSTVLFLLLAAGLSSCLCVGPGYGYRRGPGYHRAPGHHYGGGGYHHGPRNYGGGHYRR